MQLIFEREARTLNPNLRVQSFLLMTKSSGHALVTGAPVLKMALRKRHYGILPLNCTCAGKFHFVSPKGQGG